MQKSLVSNIFYKILLNTFNIILPILVGPYAYRTLGVDSMGTVNFSETIFNYFFIFAVFGVYQYGLREISLVKNDKKKVSQLFTNLYVINFTTSILALTAFYYLVILDTGTRIYSLYFSFSDSTLSQIYFM